LKTKKKRRFRCKAKLAINYSKEILSIILKKRYNLPSKRIRARINLDEFDIHHPKKKCEFITDFEAILSTVYEMANTIVIIYSKECTVK
jgi:hypothetical protein